MRAGTLSLLVALLIAGPLGCGAALGIEPRAATPLARGSLPDLAGRGPVAVVRFQNETGSPLRIPSGNPLREVARAVERGQEPGWTVTDALQAQAVQELARRGVAVRGFEADRAALPRVPADPADAARLAREARLDGPVLFGSLQRFTVTQTGMLLVRLDLVLVDPSDAAVLWAGSARRPVAVRSALDAGEILIDAAPAIFAEAFGNR